MSTQFHFFFLNHLSLIDKSFPVLDLLITNRNYRILGSLWNLSVRTRPMETLRNGAAPRGPTISCGTGALSSPLVVRHTCTHVSFVVCHPPLLAFPRCFITTARMAITMWQYFLPLQNQINPHMVAI